MDYLQGIAVSGRWSFLLLSGFVCLAGSSVATVAGEWKPQSYPADGFQIEFSAPVAVSETAISEENKSRVVRATNYVQENGASVYLVAAMLMKDAVNFDAGTSTAFFAGRCQAKKEAPVTLSGAEKGLEILGSNCFGDGSHFEQRFFQRGKWFYQITAIYPAGDTAEAARRFLNSFKLLWQAELMLKPGRAAFAASGAGDMRRRPGKNRAAGVVLFWPEAGDPAISSAG